MIWNFPTYPSVPQHGDHGTRGFDDGHGGVQGGAYGGHDQYAGGPGGYNDALEKEKEKKKKDDKKMMMGAAGGLAAGAIGGAIIADALGQPHLFLFSFFALPILDTTRNYTDNLFSCR